MILFENCLIRVLSECDLPIVLAWRNHPDVRKVMFTQHQISIEEHWKWFIKAVEDNSRRLLIIEDEKKAIGYVQFSNITSIGVADWGFYVKPNAPKGTGKKMGFMALNYAFDDLKLNKICGQAIQQNYASIEFHKYLGFTQEGAASDKIHINGEYQEIYHFRLLSDEWRLRKLNME